MSYIHSDYTDPRWQKMRLEILQRDRFACYRCCDSESTLHVHHRYYIKGREPWEYPEWSLITLCKSCHEAEHGKGSLEQSPWEYVMTHQIAGHLEFLIEELGMEHQLVSDVIYNALQPVLQKEMNSAYDQMMPKRASEEAAKDVQ